MLSQQRIEQVKSEVLKYWTHEVQNEYFRSAASGKEIGHRLADLVDDRTSALLTLKWLTKYQYDKRGEKQRSRSMGDVWLEERKIYHPVNVKIGIAGAEGQPNMVSLKKLVNAILNRWIDSYYLLIVKFRIESSITPTVYMVDLLDCFNYLTFDSGPGQIMLKAKPFFEAVDHHKISGHTLQEKLHRLMDLYKDGEERLRINRAKDVAKYAAGVEQYVRSNDFHVTPETQTSLGLR